MSLFTVEALSAGYGKTPILSNIAFHVPGGSITGILGANGSGKSTLLKSICSILPHEGCCTLSGQQLELLSPRQTARLCSYIPQRSGINIDLPLMDVMLMGFNAQLGILEQPGAKMRRLALEALAQVGLKDRAQSNYLKLSEGEKQLCILARALVNQGSMLLLDEPESSLDLRHRYRMLDLIKSWVRAKQRCALIALHDPALALEYCDQLVLLRNGRLSAIIHTAQDSISDMEAALSDIYGGVNLVRCTDRDGCDRLVMLKLREERA